MLFRCTCNGVGECNIGGLLPCVCVGTIYPCVRVPEADVSDEGKEENGMAGMHPHLANRIIKVWEIVTTTPAPIINGLFTKEEAFRLKVILLHSYQSRLKLFTNIFKVLHFASLEHR